MAKLKTLHTPATDEVKMLSIEFPDVRVAEVKRVDAASGSFKLHCSPGRDLKAICQRMGWDVPGNKSMLEKLEGEFTDGHFILTATDKLIDVEVNLPFKKINDFQLHRLELEGRKKKGFRRELRMSGTFDTPDGAALLESYMVTSDNAKGLLKISYLKEAEQPELPMGDDDENQMEIPDVHATPEQAEAVSEMAPGSTLASVRDMKAGKRGRLAEDVQ